MEKKMEEWKARHFENFIRTTQFTVLDGIF